MALPLTVKTLETIPKEFQSLYKKTDNGYELDLTEAVVPKSVHDEFRNHNVELRQAKEDLIAEAEKYKGIDPEKARTALAKLQELGDKELIDAGKIDELVEQRVERLKSELEGQVQSLQTENERLTTENTQLGGKLSTVLIDSEIQKAVSKVGSVRPNAMNHVLSAGRSVFKLIDGVPTPVGADGKTIFGKDGKTIMSFDEWANGLLQSDGFLFDGNSGGGAGGDGGGEGSGHTSIVSRDDSEAFGANLEGIADGSVLVK